MQTLPLASVLQHLHSKPSRTWSIVITIFGDAVVPRGGSLWLGSLLEIFAGMGIGGGVVRTAMSRLANDAWLERTRVGRNSFYRLTGKGQTVSATATERIYGGPPGLWDGQFRLLLADKGVEREGIRTILAQSGFGLLAPGVWIAPSSTSIPPEAAGMLQLQSTTELESGREIAARAWSLAAAAEAYRRFLRAFETLNYAVQTPGEMSELHALVARILLVHEFRRIVLRDPGLPGALLPADWPGTAARRLCAAIYRAVVPASERWLDQHGRDEAGPLPKPAFDLSSRFDAH